MSETESLLSLDFPPPLDLVWLSHEEVAGLRAPTSPLTPHDRQRLYAAQCRERNRAMMADGARDYGLAQDVAVEALHVPSREDGFEIPVLRYALAGHHDESLFGPEPDVETGVVAVYYHGGGLVVGEADSEELTCRRIVKAGLDITVYSVGYRLMPQNPASTCVADAFDAFTHLRRRNPAARMILIGSSSGGELTALVSQMAPPGSLDGVLLRCPVTVDPDHIPAPYRHMHTSASDAFVTTLLGKIKRDTPRDGLAWMPLEGPPNAFARLPRTWVQICTNDVLYSDGVCYARALKNAGVEVQIDVVKGWPHTFWLKAPHLHRALQADEEVVRALSWVLHGESGS